MPPSVATRLLNLALAITAIAALVPWSLHHPFGLTLVVPSVLAMTGLFMARPLWGLWLLPILWPIADLSPLTGWIHFPESLALVLCLVAGVGLREAIAPPPGHAEGSPLRVSPVALALFALVAVSYVVAGMRAHMPLPPFDTSLFAGYKTPLNATRLFVGFAQCLMLLPALHAVARIAGPATIQRLSLGLIGGLCTAALAATLERWDFTGLLNFSSDYRTTAQFWEMHVGGATLDAWLALTFPFALSAFLISRSLRTRVALLLALGIGAYAILTTFSRGLYAGVAVSAPLVLIMLRHATGGETATQPGHRPWAAWLGAITLCMVAPLSFAGGGYRGLAALLALAWLVYLTGGMRARVPAGRAWLVMLIGAAGGLAAFPIAAIPKAVYVVFGLLFMAGMIATLLAWRQERPGLTLAAIGLASACASAAAAVGIHWGEGKGVTGIAVASLAMAALLWTQHGIRPLWRASVNQATSVILVLGFAAALATSVGSYYVGERFSTTTKDFAGRMEHWQAGADLVTDASDAWLGIGLGRYPEAYYWSGPLAASAGTWQLADDAGNRYARLGAPRHVLGFGELFRVSQRIPADAIPPFVFRMRARGHANTAVHVEVCRKHLLYAYGCSIGGSKIAEGAWQAVELTSKVSNTKPSDLPLVFSISVEGRAALDVDDLEIIDGRGMSLLNNGDFQSGVDFWFFSSDRHHLPWHAKSLPLHVWIEHGWLGALTTGAVVIAAFGRLIAGRPRRSALAAPLAAGLAGFLVVGLFDSLLDMPRMTTIFYLGLWLALVLRAETGASASHHRARRTAGQKSRID